MVTLRRQNKITDFFMILDLGMSLKFISPDTFRHHTFPKNAVAFSGCQSRKIKSQHHTQDCPWRSYMFSGGSSIRRRPTRRTPPPVIGENIEFSCIFFNIVKLTPLFSAKMWLTPPPLAHSGSATDLILPRLLKWLFRCMMLRRDMERCLSPCRPPGETDLRLLNSIKS